jgi:hypothetical protein
VASAQFSEEPPVPTSTGAVSKELGSAVLVAVCTFVAPEIPVLEPPVAQATWRAPPRQQHPGRWDPHFNRLPPRYDQYYYPATPPRHTNESGEAVPGSTGFNRRDRD